MSENAIAVSTESNSTDFNIPENYICTVDTSTNEGKIAVAKALNGSDSLASYNEAVIHLNGIITTPGVRKMSGEACTNNYLICTDDDGNEHILFSQSDGVTRSLRVIAGLWGDSLQNGETIDVKCVEQKLKSGNTLKTIIPA